MAGLVQSVDCNGIMCIGEGNLLSTNFAVSEPGEEQIELSHLTSFSALLNMHCKIS